MEHGVEIAVSGILGWLGKKVLESGLAKRRMTEEVKAIKVAAEEQGKSKAVRKSHLE